MEVIAKNNYLKSMIQGLKKCRRKIDKEGRVEETLRYLTERGKECDVLGKGRKIYHVEHSGETMGEEEVIKRLSEKLK